MEAGIDFIGDNNVKINFKKENVSFLIRLAKNIGSFIDWLKPFKSDIMIINANYDRSISLFYQIL